MDMKRDYYEDVQFFRSKVILFWFFILMVLLALFPLFLSLSLRLCVRQLLLLLQGMFLSPDRRFSSA